MCPRPLQFVKLASQLCLRLLLKPRAFVSQIVIDFVDSQPNASGELGAVAHPLVDTGEETYCGPSRLAGTSGKKSVSFRRLEVEDSRNNL